MLGFIFLVNKMDNKRLDLIDTYRGITIISMILFHFCWFANAFGMLISTETLYGLPFTIWERTICCSFIFISGFSFSLGSHQKKNGLVILGLGIAITILSVVFTDDLYDIFGVLWLIGIAMLSTIVLDKIYPDVFKQNKLINLLFLIVSIALVVFMWNINNGYLGLRSIVALDLPAGLYKNYFTTLLGFPFKGFYSVDYFSIFPWVFLYYAGYFMHKITANTVFENMIMKKGIPFLNVIGRHSLLIYIIHPVVMVVTMYVVQLISL